MELRIEDDMNCWVCGKTFVNYKDHPEHQKTMHHVLPQHLKPINNVVVPVCKKCHEFINQSDIRGMYAFAHKFDKSLGELRKMAKELFDRVASSFKRK